MEQGIEMDPALALPSAFRGDYTRAPELLRWPSI